MGEQVVTPYSVSARNGGVDYARIVSDFGCKLIDPQLIQRLEKLTNKPAHPFLRRGIFFAHRDLESILDAYEQGHKFFLYTGRGPSSESLHLGHLVQFMFTKYLQDAFDVPLVIQLSDDEKFIWKDISQEECQRLGRNNAKDIISCGFRLERTFIFSNLDYVSGALFDNVLTISSFLSINAMSAVFGLNAETDVLGKLLYPAVQIAPAFSTSFNDVFGEGIKMRCLIPCAIDQDPYFRLSRDLAPRLKLYKPALIESRFLPSIQAGDDSGKMSASSPNSAIFVTDTLEEIKQKLAGAAVESVLAYFTFFEENDAVLEEMKADFSSGKRSLEDLKNDLSKALWEVLENLQQLKAEVDDKILSEFMRPRLIR
ncbi:tryptophan--tRNA ligase, cytoplasmic [Selaginella moellendorffii]|uniref:tryptophan--tRNA ligase, cytoplasmic n=1 Tax=Selaginella moellendorffii TaxID=88036 RepID=UPI000D1CC467|nr:tryptophan--tRNA ligase, cytoplasmic [Selaginella moellendorffii]|eukprot:XP_024519360.1 tryptophan--tRNA ligase, cytoplasmic [Selaginella moellendorffii]